MDFGGDLRSNDCPSSYQSYHILWSNYTAVSNYFFSEWLTSGFTVAAYVVGGDSG